MRRRDRSDGDDGDGSIRRVLVLQHIACEGPGTVADVLGAAGLACDLRRLGSGDPVPASLDGFSGLVVLGGPMSVNDGEVHPFLAAEDRLLREAIGRDLPTAGICLGSQLLAKAAGARVYKAREPEIGWLDVRLEAGASDDPLLSGLATPLRVFQWHGETFDLPSGAVRLASSDVCPNQAFRIGRRVHAFQFHLEVTAWMARQWCRIYAAELDEARAGALQADLFVQALRLRSLSKKVFGGFAASVLQGARS